MHNHFIYSLVQVVNFSFAFHRCLLLIYIPVHSQTMAAQANPIYTSAPGTQAPMVYETPGDIGHAPPSHPANDDHIEKVNM